MAIKFMLAGPCPFCQEKNLVLYDDGTWKCDTERKSVNAVSGERGHFKCPAHGTWAWKNGMVFLTTKHYHPEATNART